MAIITVAVPIFNAESHLENCINSIISQSFKDIEVLLVDDGSIDDSINICYKYAKLDPRVKVYSKKNEGVSSTRNYAITMAEGEYICFVDSDDKIDKYMLEHLYKDIISYNADLAICGHKSVCINNKKITVVRHNNPSFIGSITDFLNNISVFLESESIQGPCGKLYRTSIINNNKIRFPLELSFGEDTVFVYRYLSFCNKIISSSNCYYFYIKRNRESLSSSFREDKFDIYLYLYDQLKELLDKFNVSGKQEMIERRICISAISCIGELFEKDIKITKELRRNVVTNIILNETTLRVFWNHRDYNRQNKLINFLAQNKLISLIEVYFKSKSFIRNRFGLVYNLLKQ